MAKKYKIIDAEGSEYEVEEIQDEAEEKEKKDKVKDESEVLTPEEISLFKKILSKGDTLLGLLNVKDKKQKDEFEEEEEEEFEDEDEDDDDKVEEIVDTKKKKKAKDSFGANEKKSKVEDSFESEALEVDEAWKKRYGGNR